jgi:hypothetical protein
MPDGTFRPQILLEIGGECVLQTGRVCTSLKAANDAACDAAEAAIPDGDWKDRWLEAGAA